jgi:hypothetical protein
MVIWFIVYKGQFYCRFYLYKFERKEGKRKENEEGSFYFNSKFIYVGERILFFTNYTDKFQLKNCQAELVEAGRKYL